MSLNNRLAIQLALVIIFALIELPMVISDTQEQMGEIDMPDLSYIWSVSGLESNQVIMALNQDGKDLYGIAKYEPDNGVPWNAIVIGSVDGNNIDLILTSQQGSTLVSSKMVGTYDANNQSLQGEFFQASDSEILKSGKFFAIWINQDISNFIPAKEKESRPDNFDTAAQAINLTPTKIVQQKTGYYDVHQNADSIMNGVCGSLA
jgi:hypothetical protein